LVFGFGEGEVVFFDLDFEAMGTLYSLMD